jgi:hypothetical protein
MRSSRFGFIWLSMALAALGTGSAQLQANAVLTFTVASHVQPVAGKHETPTDETFPLIVTLGHQFLSTEVKGIRSVYDFERNRIRIVNLQTKTFEDLSLYSDIGFRVLEFYNRVGLGNMLRSANLKAPSSDIALVEHLFSLLGDKSSTVVDAVKIDGGTEYRWQDHVLLTVSAHIQSLPADYRGEYWRFFRYYAGGHPKIIDSLTSIQGVPQKTVIVLSNMKTETRTMTLISIALPSDKPYSLEGFTLEIPDREPYNTLKLVTADAPKELQARVASALQDRDSAFAQGKYLDAFLANFEAVLSTGQAETEWLRATRDKLTGDTLVLKLSGALGKHDPAELPRIADDLASLRALAPAHAEVLEIFEGNMRLGMAGQGKQGEELLLAAARSDPYLTGAWHDLAEYYYRSFQMQEAWGCMDVARRIAPNNPMAKSFNDVEQSLRTKNTAYF